MEMADGLNWLVLRYFGWIVVWVLIWYLLRLTEPLWGQFFAPSSKPHENDPYWMVHHIFSGLHAVFVAVLALPAFISLTFAPDDVRFAAAPHLEMCSMDAGFHPGTTWGHDIEIVALAGLAFTAFTTADIALSMVHGLASTDYMVHHAAFVVAGFILRGNCILPWKGSTQLVMEASTPFLNVMLLCLNRGDAYLPLTVPCGIIFVILYIYTRLIQNTYATVILWLRRETAFPPDMPQWEVALALIACTAGAAVQFFWFPGIVRKIMKLLSSRETKLQVEEPMMSSYALQRQHSKEANRMMVG